MKQFKITMKNGKEHVVEKNDGKTPIGLWIWSLKQITPMVLSFDKLSLMSTEIQSIEELEEELF